MHFSIDKAFEILERTPLVFEQLVSGVSQEWTHSNEGPDTFSPFDVLGHLIDGEETDWMSRAGLILNSGPDTPFEPYDRFRHYERNKNTSLSELVEEFKVLRSSNLKELRSWNLSEADLDRQGRHPELGLVTLRQLVASWVVHDLGHIGQAVRVMAKQYGQEVGPWEEYLTVLNSGPAAR